MYLLCSDERYKQNRKEKEKEKTQKGKDKCANYCVEKCY